MEIKLIIEAGESFFKLADKFAALINAASPKTAAPSDESNKCEEVKAPAKKSSKKSLKETISEEAKAELDAHGIDIPEEEAPAVEAPAAPAVEAPAVEAPAAPTISRQDVKKTAIQKIRAGHRDAVTDLIKSYGAEKLDLIQEEKLAAFAADLDKIGA